MQIAVDGRYFCSMHRSLALYTGNLLRALGELYPSSPPVVFVPSELHPISVPIRTGLGDNVRWIQLEKPIDHIGRLMPELRWVHFELPRLLTHHVPDADLIIMPYHQPPARRLRATRVVILHDLCGLGVGFPKTKKNYWRHYLRLQAAAHLADEIWPISQSTSDEMASRLSGSRKRLGPVLYNGLDKEPVPVIEVDRTLSKYGLVRHGYVVAFATWQERKNFTMSLATVRALRHQGHPVQMLGIAPEGERDSLLQRCRDAGEIDAIVLSDVSDPELDALYAGALALLWPSTCEGFGYPVVEAMAQGCPPLVGSIGPGAELVGAVWDPVASFDARSFAARLTELRSKTPTEYEELKAALRERASEFSSETFRARLASNISQLMRPEPD